VITETLKFRLADGGQAVAEAELDETEFPTGEFLMARRVLLTDGERELRQHRAVSGRYREKGYERLDNEVLAGRRLAEAAGRGGYPPEVVRLHGDDADGANPYALFERYRGKPLRDAMQAMTATEQQEFPVSLLRGLCWLAAVGIAHRGIGPETVWWDGRCAQIVDFSECTVFGVTRRPVRGFPAWVPVEQRPDTANGRVGPRDDTWAAAQLIFWAHTQGQECVDPDQLAASGLDSLLVRALVRAFGPLAVRPTASELLTQLGRSDPAPQGFSGTLLLDGRNLFRAARARKRPNVPVPPDFNDDLDWALNASSPAPPPAVAAATLEPFPGGPTVFAVPPTGEPPDVGGGLTGGASTEQQASQAALGQHQASRKKKTGLFGHRRDKG
jgi:serine/threonine protein kinase